MSLGDYCFINCSNLRSIEIPRSVERLGTNCFKGCLELKTVRISKNLNTDKNIFFKYTEIIKY
jgi:hypothetical protein